MKICYLDESGHCGIKYNEKQPVETVVGVVSDMSKIFKTQKEHNTILDILTTGGIGSIELKAVEIYRGRKEWSKVNPEIRVKIYELLLQWAVDRKCKFILCPIDSDKFFKLVKNNDRIALKFQYPYEAAAFNSILAVQREFRNYKKNKGRTLMVFDEQKKHDENLLRLLESDLEFTDQYTCYKPKPRAKSDPRLDQIIDIPHFSKSHMAVMLQIADIAAFIVNRHILLNYYNEEESYKGEKDKIDNWYLIIIMNTISKSSLDPPGKDELITFYRNVRPNKWQLTSIK